MKTLPWLAAVAAMVLMPAAPVRAADYPDVVRKAVEDAGAQCVQLGGKPARGPATIVADLDGNGGEDWIVDYAKQDCQGVPPPFCGSAGCALQIYLWQSGATWKLVFDHNVESWRRGQIRGKPGLFVSLHGSACGRTGSQRCRERYVFSKGKLLRR